MTIEGSPDSKVRVSAASSTGSSATTSHIPENNHLGPGREGKAWADVLVGFSSGADPLYQDLKEHVGPFHWTPLEAFALSEAAQATDGEGAGSPAAASPVAAEDLTVVSWVPCQSDEAKRSNSRETRYPSETWARTRMFGQECNIALHRALVAALPTPATQPLRRRCSLNGRS